MQGAEMLIIAAMQDRIFPGCVLGVYDAGAQIIRACGRPTYESAFSVDEHSVYDVASLTKTIVTATVMFRLIDEGKCMLKDPIAKYIPEFAANGKQQVLIEHAMSYTILLDYAYTDFWNGSTMLMTFPQILQVMCDAPLKAPPGEKYLYTDATAVLLGELIRRIGGAELDALFERMVATPLGMKDSTLHPERLPRERIVPTEYRPNGTLVWGAPHDEKAYVAYESGTHSGLAGLFTTAPDILRWVDMMFGGKKLLSESAIRLMTTDYYPDKPFRSTLGWGDGPTFESMNGIGGPKLLVKGGFTGCFLIGDMKKKKALVFLSNRVYPKRPENVEPWKEFRRNIIREISSLCKRSRHIAKND